MVTHIAGCFSFSNSEAAKTALNVIAGAAGEGTEEFIAEIAQGYLDKLTIQTDERNFWQMVEDGAYNAIVGNITALLFGVSSAISGGDGKLPTANEIEELTTQAAEETSAEIGARLGNENIGGRQRKSDLMTGEVRVERDALGNVTVIINEDVLTGKPKAEWRKTISNELQRIFHNGVRLPRGVIFSNKKGRGEFTNGSYTRMLERTDPAMYEDKMRMATGTEELLKNAENIINEDPAHNRADDIVSFNRGNFRVKVKGAGYTGNILTAIYSDGKEVFFDINNLERNKNEATPERYASGDAKGFSQTGVASKINIPQSKTEVNGVAADKQFPLLYTERLLEQAKTKGNLYTQRLLLRQIEKAMQNSRSADTEASTPMPTIYADYLRKHNMLDDYEAEAENSDGFEELIADLENYANSDTINVEDIVIGKSLGAKAKNYDIELPNGETIHLTEGTKVFNVKIIAGKGRDRQIDEIDFLLERFGGNELEWQKKKGLGYVDYQGESFLARLHWYEEPTAGKHKWKVKPDADGNWFLYED